MPLPFVSQLVALAYRIGYHDLLDGLPLNVAVKVDRSAGGGFDDGDGYAPPSSTPTSPNPLLQHIARLSDAGSRPNTPPRRQSPEASPERGDSPPRATTLPYTPPRVTTPPARGVRERCDASDATDATDYI